MFIRKQVISGRAYFFIEERYRRKDKRNPATRLIVSLGREKSLITAYEKELTAFLKSADKLERLEYVMNILGTEAAYHDNR